MSIERSQRVHATTSGATTCIVKKVRQGDPTEDMARVEVTSRRVSLELEVPSPVPGLSQSVAGIYLDIDDARDLGAAIEQAAEDLATEERSADR